MTNVQRNVKQLEGRISKQILEGMNIKLLHFTTMFREKKKAKHCNLSASLSYPDILQQTIENYTYKVS